MRWWSRWLLLAGLAYLVLAVVWTDTHRYAGQRQDLSVQEEVDSNGEPLTAPVESSDIFAPFSVFNTAPEGMSQAYEYLRRRSPDAAVEILGRAIDGQDLPSDGVVFRVATGWTDIGSLEALFERLEEELEEELEEAEGEEDSDADAETEADGKSDAPDDGLEADGTAESAETETEIETETSETVDPSEQDAPTESDDPGQEPSEWQMPGALSPRAVEWVRAGGRLVIGFEGKVEGLATEDHTEKRSEGVQYKVFPLWPEVQLLDPPIPRTLHGDVLGQSHAVLLWNDAPLLSRWPLGRGEVIWLATPEILQNQHLRFADHLALLQALAGSERTVYFDETLHGTQHGTGTLFLLGRWRLIPWLLLWMLACLAVWWRHARAVGPAEDPYRERRSEAVDMVDSLAALYGRALRRRDALQLYHHAFVEQVGWRLGLQGEDAERKAEEFLGGPLAVGLGSRDISHGDLQRQLQRINEGFRRIEHGNRF